MRKYLYIFISLCLLSCKTTKVVEDNKEYVGHIEKDSVTTAVTNDVYKVRIDSVFIKDSTSTIIRNDTVFRDMWHTIREVESDTLIIYGDSIRTQVIEKIDTCYIDKVHTEYVTKEKNILDYIWDILGYLGVLFVIIIIYNVLKRKFSS